VIGLGALDAPDCLIEDNAMDRPLLEVQIYQLVDDAMLKKNRHDGTGWDWCWADWQRDWMNATPLRYAYRCLPLTIINQTGWWIKNPVGFTAIWRGRSEPGGVEFHFDSSNENWGQWINSQFGEGIITWNTPFLFRTKPEGSRLLVCGPANYFKTNASPLTALIESDWMSMSFTMNWKILAPDQPVRFEVGEPLFQAIPLSTNICKELETASVSYQKLSDDPELELSYWEWDQARRRFHSEKRSGEVKPHDWQKDYFQGRDATGREAPAQHMIKIKPPKVQFAREKTGSPVFSSLLGDVVEKASQAGGREGESHVGQKQEFFPLTHQMIDPEVEPTRPHVYLVSATIEQDQDATMKSPPPEDV
jgi:hypothetical protein